MVHIFISLINLSLWYFPMWKLTEYIRSVINRLKTHNNNNDHLPLHAPSCLYITLKEITWRDGTIPHFDFFFLWLLSSPNHNVSRGQAAVITTPFRALIVETGYYLWRSGHTCLTEISLNSCNWRQPLKPTGTELCRPLLVHC